MDGSTDMEQSIVHYHEAIIHDYDRDFWVNTLG